MWIASNSRSAMPDFSSIAPMKTNSGTAANTKFDDRSSIFSMNWCTTLSPKITSPKVTAVIIIAKTTCTPRNISPKASGSIRNGSASIGQGSVRAGSSTRSTDFSSSTNTCSANRRKETKNTSRNGQTGRFSADWPLRSPRA